MDLDLDAITAVIIDAAIEIHRALGPGLLESVYVILLADELVRRGFSVERQVSIPFIYKGRKFERGLRVDLLINSAVVVEVKSAAQVTPVHMKQVLTYLRLLDLRVGLLINFGEATLKSGLRRIVNSYESPATPRLRVNQAPSRNQVT